MYISSATNVDFARYNGKSGFEFRFKIVTTLALLNTFEYSDYFCWIKSKSIRLNKDNLRMNV